MATNAGSKFGRSLIGRRRLLGAGLTSSLGLLGAAAIACGDKDDTPQSAGGQQTSASSPTGAASSAQADAPKRGGVWSIQQATSPLNLDPYSNAVSTVGGAHYVYSRLFTIESTKPDAAGQVPIKLVGDAAESIAVSPDGKTYTVKLRGAVKFHPPINRQLDAEDIVFSWKRFTGRLPGSTPSPNANLLSIIDDVQAPESNTVVFRLSKPFGPFNAILADASALLIMPKETGTAFDPAKTMVGTGPWVLKEFVPNTLLSLRRNPEWHFGPERPYFDEVQISILADRANIVNQFLAGKLDRITISGDDLANVSSQLKDVQIVPQGQESALVGWWSFSSVSDAQSKAPWARDRRVRQAMSMALDRDAMIDAAYGKAAFNKAGFQFDVPWQGVLPASFGSVVIKPRDDARVSSLYKYDPKAAKALLDQAGGGFTLECYDTAGSSFGPEHDTLTQLSVRYWNEIGIKANLKQVDFRSEYIPNIYQARKWSGDQGVAHVGQAGIVEQGVFLQSTFTNAGVNGSKVEDPIVNAALDKYFAETDAAKRDQLLKDLQYHLMNEMYYVTTGWGSFPTVYALRPNVRNFKDYKSFGYGAGGQDSTYFWKA